MRKTGIRGLAGVCAATAVLALAASNAGAVTLFSDNFNGEPVPTPPGWVPNYATFANFFVGGPGTVDLLGPTNPFSLTGSGNFVDLDGSTGLGTFLETIPQFNYTAGETVTLNLLVSGNQRGGTDTLFGGFRFFTPRDVGGINLGGFTSFQTPDTPSQLLIGIADVPSNSPYQTYSISFTAPVSGTISAIVGTTSADNVGPLLDGVTLTAVPEPASWTLLIAGFGGVGWALRRRRSYAIA
jgi:hypothetical protein